jgi:hypothetical protein
VAGYIWRIKVPFKIKFFLWKILNNKLKAAVNLAKRDWHVIFADAWMKLTIFSSNVI